MRKFKTHITCILIIVLSIIIISCEKIIEIELGDAKNMLVVNAVIDTDSIFEIHLSSTRHILDNNPIEPINDAEIRVYENTVFKSYLNIVKNGWYNADFKATQDLEYELIIKHSKYNDIVAYCRVPQKVPIISIDTSSTIGEFGEPYITFNLQFADPEDKNNYYLLSMNTEHVYYDNFGEIEKNEDAYYYSSEAYLESDDPIVEANLWQGGIIFSDNVINGQTYNLSFKTNRWSFDADTNYIHIHLKSITLDLYKYYLSLESHYETQGNPFAEPIPVYSNINNGIGIFGAVTKSSKELIIVNERNRK